MARKPLGIKFAATLLALGILGGGGIYAGCRYYQLQQQILYRNTCLNELQQMDEQGEFLPGIVVEGVKIGGMTRTEAAEALEKKADALRPDIDIALTYQDKSFPFTTEDFSFTNNIEEVLDEAYALGRESTEDDRLATYEALKATPRSFDLTVTLDDSTVEELVKPIAKSINQKATDGTVEFHPLESEKFTYKKGKKGVKSDVEATCEKLRALLASDQPTGTMEIVVEETKPKLDLDALKERTVLLSTFSTTATNTAEARFNMSKALSRINGLILAPDDTFSFNKVVGNSSIAADGWKAAGTLSGGRIVQDYGGGVCQAATTLYGALMRGNIYVSERSNHAWPSSYVPTGQDATISYGSLDLKFENNTGYTIYLEAYMNDPTLTVNIYGYHPTDWDEIKVTSEVTETYSPGKTIRKETSSLPKGQTKEDITARTGYSARGQKEFYKDGKLVKTSPIFSSYYAPVTGVILVGTGE